MKNSVSDCSFYINSEEEDDEEKDKKSIEDGNDSDSSHHFTDFLWAHIYERFSTEKRRRNTCAVCAETVKWVAYGPCGHREVCSTCIFRLCFIYGSACARVNLRSSLSSRLGISCNLRLAMQLNLCPSMELSTTRQAIHSGAGSCGKMQRDVKAIITFFLLKCFRSET